MVSPPAGLVLVADFVARNLERLANPDASACRLAASLGLTPRRSEVFVCIARGDHREAIVDALAISGNTLDKHLHRIYEAVGEYSIAAVRAWALSQP